DFFRFARRLIGESALPPQALCFELTESAAVSDLPAARRHIGGLRSQGCKIALDDFGSGVSSLGYLRQLDVDLLKIFGSLVRGAADDPVSFAMVRSVHEVARAAGLATVAEYVETPEVLEAVRSIGVDYGQGHALGRPVPLTTVLERIAEGRSPIDL
ncbi:MAG: EAL domain-containing protein, partial [Acidimicrobiia bacterium]|nr:EAL domain-containing protein [Acidimicrobiia bacterium]